MSDFPTTPERAAPPAPTFAPPSARMDIPRALRALRSPLRDRENTSQVFEIMRALNGGSAPRNYRRLLRTAHGGRIAYEHEELLDLLDDDQAMSAYPQGTVGGQYLAWRKAENLSAEGLAQESRKGLDLSKVELRHPYAWFGRRLRDTHDLWHIVSGYGRDGLGEACLVAFSFAQTGGPGWAAIAVGASFKAFRLGGGWEHVAAIWEGYRRGRKAAWLPGEDYRVLLAEPVESARRRLGIGASPKYDAVPPERRDRVAGQG
jgi:ubiquinone biosynthesis protein COQ4